MHGFQLRLFLLCCGMLAVAACTERQDQPAIPAAAKPPAEEISTRSLLTEGVSLQRVELTTEALVVWRRYAAHKPALLLLSARPMLAPVPEPLRGQVVSWVQQAGPDEIVQRSAPEVPRLLLLLDSTVDAAIRAGWLREVHWVVPVRKGAENSSVEALRGKLVEKGQLLQEEAAALVAEGARFSGPLRGIPFSATLWPELPTFAAPVIVHLDLSFIAQLYKNEVATPALPLILSALKTLREKKIPVVAVTFSYGNLENRISLDVRYQGEIIAAMIEQPQSLEQPLPVNWQRQGDIFYLNDLFQRDRAHAVAEEMEKTDPGSAWVKFSLYRSAVARKQGRAALDYLAAAVQKDSIFAVEYLALAKMARERRRPDQALKMLDQAAEAFPWNTQIQLGRVRLAAELGEWNKALRLLDELRRLPWEPVYYPQMPAYLERLRKEIEAGRAAPIAPSGQP